MTFQNLIQESSVLQALEEQGFNTPTPIQEKAIPAILQGRDVRGSAQTGTGKTAAFILPALCRLAKHSPGSGPRILVLVPTRELAMQVAAETVKLGKHVRPMATVCIYGGAPYPVQNRQLSKKYEILIATPGRLIDHIEQKRINLSRVEMLILDEADRMLDMGFIDPVKFITSLTPKKRQTLMFSATYGKKVVQLAQELLRDPVEVKIDAVELSNELIEQRIHPTHNLEHKYKMLEHLLVDPSIDQVIVFASTKSQVDQVADQLIRDGFQAGALHGDMRQGQRTSTMRALREKRIRILVATDVAARGIDVLTISHVINFDLPHRLDEYIHRIGRTGRAGSKGIAISFASSRDAALRKEIEKFTGQRMTTLAIPGYESTFQPSDPKKARRKRPVDPSMKAHKPFRRFKRRRPI